MTRNQIGCLWRDQIVGEQLEIGFINNLEVTEKKKNYTDMDNPNYIPKENEKKRKLYTANESLMDQSNLNSFHDKKRKINQCKELSRIRCSIDNKLKPRILPLIECENKTIDQFLDELCKNLHETNKTLMSSLLSKIEKNLLLEKYEKTRLIEANGGQLIKNGGRRRTSGGIFFNLIKEDSSIPKLAKKELFGCQDEELKKKKKREKVKRKIKKLKLQKLNAKNTVEENVNISNGDTFGVQNNTFNFEHSDL
ncbi:phosphorylated adapter RNA export protein [Daktulosphaira vitifoliae]|uniref:phosphorylated adapter RNA export protein n=1 Tax=Daktulosphaira vitifoliae TaxID=58002 RepID=UPI0021A98518|nr:phosphorylated adapter RNA export protein [Daktulosphaira vitifoliae]